MIIHKNISVLARVGSFQIIVVKLHIYKDSNVGNLRKFRYCNEYFRHLRNAFNTIHIAI